MIESTANDFVTIVSGLPRSGTSMMMRMLEAAGMPIISDQLRTADDDNPRGYYEFEPAKKTKQDSTWLKSAGGKAVKMVYRLLYDLPPDYQYRVIFMRRHMDEILKSQQVMLQRSGQVGGRVSDDKIAKLFAQEIDAVRTWYEKQPHMQVLEVQYNDMVASPDEPVAQIASFLGGNLDVDAMCEVVEPQLYRNRA